MHASIAQIIQRGMPSPLGLRRFSNSERVAGLKMFRHFERLASRENRHAGFEAITSNAGKEPLILLVVNRFF